MSNAEQKLNHSAEQTALYKQQAAERAVDFIESGMIIGLGTGSTAIYATRRIAQLINEGRLQKIIAYATSQAVAVEAARLGLTLMAEEMPSEIDLTIDGADEVDPHFDLIKGGGGALLREKIVAQASRQEIIVVDESKLSPRLGTFRSLPVEAIRYGWRAQVRFLESLGAVVTLRTASDGSTFTTDSGNLILDCNFGPIEDADLLAEKLSQRAGIVEHGLFLKLTSRLIVAGPQGISITSGPLDN